MKRRLIRQANQAYTLTLPVEWVRKNKLGAKSEVDVEEVEKSLVIRTSGGTVGGTVSFAADGMANRTLYQTINAYYAKGMDEITITSSKEVSSEIVMALQQTIGFALVRQQKGVYTIKDISGVSGQDLDEIFKRVFQMILQFYDAAIEDILGDRKETIDNLEARDEEVNKFTLYLERAINRMAYPDSVKGRVLFTYSFMLEKLGDEVERLWRTSIERPIKNPEVLRPLFEDSKKTLEIAFTLHYHPAKDTMATLFSVRNKVRAKALALKMDAATADLVRHIVKISDDTGDLTHLSLMMR